MDKYRTVSPFSNYLPPDLLSGLVGRTRELEEIRSAFQRDIRGVMVLGAAGVGKTTLVSMFFRQYRDQFPGGVYGSAASWAESPTHLINRVLSSVPKEITLLVIDDAEALDNAGIIELQSYVQEHSSLRVILTSRHDLPLPTQFHRIHLSGLNREEFSELLNLRNAIVHGKFDEALAERLFKVAGGNALFANLAVDAVRNGIVSSWEELFQHLRAYSTPGIVGIDGQPLTQESGEYKRIIIDVSATNSKIFQILKKDPELSWKLPPRKFEEIVAEILEHQGYEVELTPASGDGGFDIYAAKKEGLGKFLFLVECKRYVPPNKVGVEIARSLYGVVQSKKATAGAIVTTSFFTSGAESFQREVQHQMSLHDYIILQKWIKDFPLRRDGSAA
jgi:restriction system protein